MTIHPELQKKLDELSEKYMTVTKFAELLPVFSKEIIYNEITGEHYAQIAQRFGKLPFHWGINWYTNEPTNYPESYPKFTGAVSVYINTITLFGDECSDFARQELVKVLPSIKVFFYDNWNTTFYFKPDEVEEGLKALEYWYVTTCNGVGEYKKQKRKQELEAELAKLSQ